MNKCERAELEQTAKDLMNSQFVRRLSRLYPIKIFPERDTLIICIELRDTHGKLVDVLDIPTDSKGFVHPEVALHFIVIAFEMGLEDNTWKEAAKRLRQMKF